MSLFGSASHKKEEKAESVLLIDIAASSVAGAYARYTTGALPTILYTRRLPIESREGEPLEKAMLRALQILGEELIREGAPVLARATGSGSAHDILVSVDAPWQKTSVRIEHLEQKEPFLFTKALVAKKLDETRAKVDGKVVADESVIGTILNGYETNEPYGKQAHRAAIVVLTSLIDSATAEGILSTLRGLYHTKRILPIAGNSLRYQAMRRAFPHERDAIVLDATESLTSIALVRKNLFVAIIDIPDQVDSGEAWAKTVVADLGELAKTYPLPRTIFLLAREADGASLQEKLAIGKFGGLWLSDSPPRIVAVLASHFASFIRQTATTPPDLPVVLMALYWQERAGD